MQQLTKSQLQEMLREMGVSCPAGATKMQLAQLLQEANHANWLKAANAGGKKGTVRIRRKAPEARPAEESPAENAIPDLPAGAESTARRPAQTEETAARPAKARESAGRPTGTRETAGGPARTARAAGNPAVDRRSKSGKPSTPKRVAADGPPAPRIIHAAGTVLDPARGLETRAIQRSGGNCELCGQPRQKGRPLEICLFTDPPDGIQPSLKHLAVLCRDCHEKVAAGKEPILIKTLKKKLRQSGHSPIIENK